MSKIVGKIFDKKPKGSKPPADNKQPNDVPENTSADSSDEPQTPNI